MKIAFLEVAGFEPKMLGKQWSKRNTSLLGLHLMHNCLFSGEESAKGHYDAGNFHLPTEGNILITKGKTYHERESQ